MRLRVQATDVHRKSRKTKVTLLVMKHFLDFLGTSRACAIIVFYISGFGNNLNRGLCNFLYIKIMGNIKKTDTPHKNYKFYYFQISVIIGCLKISLSFAEITK
jgi:hypothetical protein